MDPTFKAISILHQTLILSLLFSTLLPPFANTTNSDYTSLVYKNCNNQTTHSSQTLVPSLFQDLIPHSSNSKFFKSTAGDQNAGVSGLFQCRGDLTDQDCFHCVNTLPRKSDSLCGNSVSGRIQLSGCYFHYKTDKSIKLDDYADPNKHDLLHKICGEKAELGLGFEEVRDHAFAELESGVVEGDHEGFYEGDYGEKMHVMAQCQGDLLGEHERDCGECVRNAVRLAREECGESISGQVYMDGCFMSYSYYPYGIPDKEHHHHDHHDGTGKIVAIVLGGAAALVFGFVFLMFLKSCGKKDDDL